MAKVVVRAPVKAQIEARDSDKARIASQRLGQRDHTEAPAKPSFMGLAGLPTPRPQSRLSGICIAVMVSACTVVPALAAEPLPAAVLEATLSAGFDSNPAQRRDGAALGFAALALGLDQRLPQGLRLKGDLWLRDYAGHNDNGRLDLSLLSSQRFGRTQIDLWAEAGWYRDQLVSADERNETAIGGLLRRPLGNRFDLALFSERRWLDYRNQVLPWAGRPGGFGSSANGPPFGESTPNASPANGFAPGTGQGSTTAAAANHDNAQPGPRAPRIDPRQRSDRLDLIALETTWFSTATSSLTLGLERRWRHSSIPLDARREQSVRLSLAFDPSANWSLGVTTGLSRHDYRQASRGLERIDHQRWLGVELRRWLPTGGVLYCAFDHLDSRSTITAAAFTQWVSDCGWNYRF